MNLISSELEKIEDLKNLGGKAKSLAILKKNNFPVPAGFVITREVNIRDISDQDFAIKINEIGGFPLVARSSALNEDGAEKSLAGVYDSYLNIATVGELREKINLVRLSVDQQRARIFNRDSLEQNMTVLIQKQIQAQISGVIFSVNPLTGNEDEIFIECANGLADQLVSGRTIPKSYIVNPNAEIIFQSAETNCQLTLKQLKNLLSLTQKSAALWGCPQDVEWCIDKNDNLWIVQSRPITKIYYRKDIGEWTNADFREGGVSAGSCLPLMASLYDRVFQSSLTQYFRDIKLLKAKEAPDVCGYFYGRLYWNTSVVKNLLKKIPGFSEEEFDKNLGINREYGAGGCVQTPVNLKTIIPFLPSLIALENNFKKSIELAKNYKIQFNLDEKYFLETINQVSQMGDLEFKAYFIKIIDFHFQVESDYFTTIYNSTNYQSLLKDELKKINQNFNTQIEYLDLISDLGEIAHLRVTPPMEELAEIKKQKGSQSLEYQKQLAKIANDFYYFSDSCLNLQIPRWKENPSQIESHLSGSESKAKDLPNTYSNAITAIKKASSVGLFKTYQGNQFIKKINKAREFLILREAMRDLSTRLYYFIRLVTLEMGKRLAAVHTINHPDDIFYLEIEDLILLSKQPEFIQPKSISPESILPESTMAESILAKFKLASEIKDKVTRGFYRYHSYLNYPAPNEFGMNIKVEEKKINKNFIVGIGCSNGIKEGIAFVAKSLEEAQNIPEDRILVTQFTEPGWTPLFPRLTGVITEVGGVLSHAAVISREFGLPAVLNVSQATNVIKTGQRLRMNGQRGTVEILDRASNDISET